MNHLAVAPDGNTLASGDNGGEVRLWDIPSGKVLSKADVGKWNTGPLAFLPDGKQLAVAADEHIGIRDVASLKEVRRGHDSAAWFRAVVPSPDGALLASVGHVVRVWDVKSGAEVLHFDEARWPHECLAFSPDGKTLAAGGGDDHRNTIDLWDVAAAKRVRELAGHALTVHALTFLPAGGTLVSVSADRTIVWWDTRTGKILRARETEDQISALALSPDGGTLVTNGDRRSALVVHKARDGEPLPNLPVPGSNPHSLAFGLGGRILATADYHFKGVNLWNFAARRLSVRIEDDLMESDPALAVSPDGKTLAVSAWPSGAILYELATGRERLRIERRGSVCYSLAFAPNGQALAMSDRGGIEFRGVLRGKEMGRLRTPAYQSRLTFSPDGGRLASSGSDTAILIWDTSRRGGERVEPRKFGEKELAVLESDLRGPDARKAYQALAALAASPGQAVALLKHRLRPVERVPDSRVDAMIAALGSDDLETREATAVGLGAMGAAAGARLRKALESKLDLEIVLRIKGLLAEVGRHPAPPRRLWEIRAIELLERIATPEARSLLRAIASGDPRAERSLDARAALGRLAKAAPG